MFTDALSALRRLRGPRCTDSPAPRDCVVVDGKVRTQCGRCQEGLGTSRGVGVVAGARLWERKEGSRPGKLRAEGWKEGTGPGAEAGGGRLLCHTFY